MPKAGANVVDQWPVSREDQDRIGSVSQEKAAVAQAIATLRDLV